MKFKTLKAGLTSLVLSVSSIANAGLILGPTDIDASAPEVDVFFSSIDALIDQSGLSGSYISGVTDFDSFVTGTTSSADLSDPEELGGVLGLGSFYFDLGALFSVDSVAIWGQSGSATLSSYNLYSSDTFGITGSRSLIGTFSASAGPNAVYHSFSGINTRYLEVDVLSNQGYQDTRFNEIVFGGNSVDVPEPSTLAIFALGMIGLASRRFKKQS